MVGTRTVVTRWPSELSEIVTRKDGRTSVNEAASRNVQIANDVWAKNVVEIDGESFGVIVLGAAIQTQTGAQGIGWKVKQSKVGKARE